MDERSRHLGLPFNTLNELYSESGLELNKLVLGFGLSFAYRYDFITFPRQKTTSHSKFTFNLKIKCSNLFSHLYFSTFCALSQACWTNFSALILSAVARFILRNRILDYFGHNCHDRFSFRCKWKTCALPIPKQIYCRMNIPIINRIKSFCNNLGRKAILSYWEYRTLLFSAGSIQAMDYTF